MFKRRKELKKLKNSIEKSGLFDKIYYLKNNHDVRVADLTPLEHYCQVGIKEDRKPSVTFDPVWYKQNYADIKADGIYPLVHFIKFGRKENRFQSESEKNEYEKLKNEGFNIELYKNTHEDLKIQDKDFNFILHYIRYGKFEGRMATFKKQEQIANDDSQEIKFDFFDTEKYLQANPDAKEAIEQGKFKNALEHFINCGYKEIQQGLRLSKVVQPNFNGDFPIQLIDPKQIDLTQLNSLDVPIFKMPVVSIIIPAYNQANYTYACVASIINHTSDVSYDIIIMDDKSPSADARNLDHKIKNITFITNEENLGFLRNCNKGAEFAKGKYILFLNNDTNVQQYWLSSLVSLMESDETIGMVGSRLVYPDGRQQEAGGIIWNDASGWNFGRLDDPTKPEYNYVKEVDYISGAAIMIKKDLWDEIGGFDERYTPAYYEDTDLAFEVRKHGYKVMYQPRSVVVHFEGISNGTDLGSGIKRYQVVNNQKFLEKWKTTLESEQYPNAQDVFKARDRSKNKPHVLFVDHYLPHYDQDAGSKAAYQYLQILANSGMQVHFLGDNFWYYPDTPYLDALQQLGIEVLYGNWYANNWQNWLQENGKYLDYVVLSRPHISVKYIDLVREYTNAKIIYFGHDLHFLREQREYEIKQEEHYLKSSEKWKDQELELMRRSDISYFFSDVERDVIKKVDPSINVDVVPLFIYDKFQENNYQANKRKDLMFVGGFGHSPNVDAVKWFVKDIFPIIQKEIPDIHFYIIGSKPPQEIQELINEHITVTGFISDQELEEYYTNCKLVVAPLRYGAGIKGKIIDALYHAIPVVTTSIGSEGINRASEIMKVADESQTFADVVINLYKNQKLLEELSKKSLENCKEYFSEEYAVAQIQSVIQEIGIY